MKQNLKLMPCPWCHCAVKTHRARHWATGDRGWYIGCESLSCKILPRTNAYQTREEAIEAWTPKEERRNKTDV